MAKRKRTNNDLQNTTKKNKDRDNTKNRRPKILFIRQYY